jgi:hypothetical protein
VLGARLLGRSGRGWRRLRWIRRGGRLGRRRRLAGGSRRRSRRGRLRLLGLLLRGWVGRLVGIRVLCYQGFFSVRSKIRRLELGGGFLGGDGKLWMSVPILALKASSIPVEVSTPTRDRTCGASRNDSRPVPHPISRTSRSEVHNLLIPLSTSNSRISNRYIISPISPRRKGTSSVCKYYGMYANL